MFFFVVGDTRTWFKNVNQSIPRTSWLRRFSQKVCGAWARNPRGAGVFRTKPPTKTEGLGGWSPPKIKILNSSIKSTISQKLKIRNGFFIRFSTLRNFSVNLANLNAFFQSVTHLKIQVSSKIVNTISHKHRPIQWKDLKLPVNGAGSGVPTDVIFIYSICFKHFLIDLGC